MMMEKKKKRKEKKRKEKKRKEKKRKEKKRKEKKRKEKKRKEKKRGRGGRDLFEEEVVEGGSGEGKVKGLKATVDLLDTETQARKDPLLNGRLCPSGLQ